RQRLKRSLAMGEAIEIAIQIGSGLAAAHSAGITHRDIKPENIMIRNDGYVKMLDFGLAKLTESAFIAGDDLADTHAEAIDRPPPILTGPRRVPRGGGQAQV